MDIKTEKKRLQDIAHVHSYMDGFNGRLTQYRAKKIKELYKGGGRLLDIGAGEGVLTNLIAANFEEIWIVEESELYIKKAAKTLERYNTKVFHQLMEEFRTQEKFDLVVAAGVLEHVKEPRKILRKVKSWLRDRGQFIAIVPNALSLHRRVGLHMGFMRNYYELGELDAKVGHRRYYDLDSLKDAVMTAGLYVISSGGILLKPLPNIDMERLSEGYCDALYELGRDYPELCAEVFVSCSLKNSQDT